MFIHPLARDDQHLIQDFILTKIALLLSQHAEQGEWEFEMAAMDEKASEGGSRSNAFFFVYTVARYRVALTRARSAAATDTEPDLHEDSTFRWDFIHAVAHNDANRALELWLASPFSLETAISSPSVQRLIFPLLDAFSENTPTLLSTNLADFLPDPFTPTTTPK